MCGSTRRLFLVEAGRGALAAGVSAALGWPAGHAVAQSPRQHFIRAEKQALDQRVADFMASYDVPGMSIAVARHGRMVLVS